MPGPLQGVRVLDCSWLLLDYIGLILANDGADVIHVEEPKQGDYMRFFLGQVRPGWSPPFINRNVNKRSLTVNLKTSEGLEAFNKLAATADVLLTVYTADAPARLGIDYESIRKVNPEIIYAQVTGYGAAGPYSGLPTHGQHFDAHTGAFEFEMGGDGLAVGKWIEPSSYRRLPNVQGGSLMPALAITGALLARERTGKGGFFDISAGDGAMATDWFSLTLRMNQGTVGPVDSAAIDALEPGRSARMDFYATGNQRYVLVDFTDARQWQAFCAAIDRQHLATVTDDARVREELKATFQARGLQEWIDLASAHHLPIGPVVFTEDLPKDVNVRARHAIVDMHHPELGPWYVHPSPLSQGRTLERPTPGLGQHTEELLRELGYTRDDYARFKTAGIV